MIVGADGWMIEGDVPFTETRWFTGSNIVDHVAVRPQDSTNSANQGLTRIFDSEDGNPGRPVRVPDVMPK